MAANRIRERALAMKCRMLSTNYSAPLACGAAYDSPLESVASKLTGPSAGHTRRIACWHEAVDAGKGAHAPRGGAYALIRTYVGDRIEFRARHCCAGVGTAMAPQKVKMSTRA